MWRAFLCCRHWAGMCCDAAGGDAGCVWTAARSLRSYDSSNCFTLTSCSLQRSIQTKDSQRWLVKNRMSYFIFNFISPEGAVHGKGYRSINKNHETQRIPEKQKLQLNKRPTSLMMHRLDTRTNMLLMWVFGLKCRAQLSVWKSMFEVNIQYECCRKEAGVCNMIKKDKGAADHLSNAAYVNWGVFWITLAQ